MFSFVKCQVAKSCLRTLLKKHLSTEIVDQIHIDVRCKNGLKVTLSCTEEVAEMLSNKLLAKE